MNAAAPLPRIAALLVLAVTLTAGGLFAQTSQSALEPAQGTKPAGKAKDPALVPVEDTPGLPRVLLIGDSISLGYTLPVRELLQGRANVHRAPENCGPTERGIAMLDKWLAGETWDVIHFNFGLHDMKYLDEKGNYVDPSKGKQVAPPETYAAQLGKLASRLKATGAKVIFATTTPVPPGAKGRVAGDETIYNKAALRVMEEQGIPVDDLCAVATKQIATQPPGTFQQRANVHYTTEGYRELARQVADSIGKELSPTSPIPPTPSATPAH